MSKTHPTTVNCRKYERFSTQELTPHPRSSRNGSKVVTTSQAENAGSIPVARSKGFGPKPFNYNGLKVTTRDHE